MVSHIKVGHYKRIIGILTCLTGLLYIPSVLKWLWNSDSTMSDLSVSLVWSFVCVFIGIALCSKDWSNLHVAFLVINLIYHLIWSYLIIDQVLHLPNKQLQYLPYYIHIVLVVGCGAYFIIYNNKKNTV